MKLRIRVEGTSYDVEVEFLDSARPANGDAHTPRIQIPETVLRERPPQKLPEDRYCRSPIAGRIASVVGSAGQKVSRNQPVLVIEAMKMEIQIGPVVDGTVTAIRVEAGEMVKPGQVLFELA